LDADSVKRLLVETLDPKIADNPYNFVLFSFPWGKKGTPLEHHKGPRSWQKEELLAMAEHLVKVQECRKRGDAIPSYQSATASGRGVGKSSMVAWIILWFLTTRLGSTVIVAANSEAQLKTRTWAELGKWLALSIHNEWFEKTTMSLRPSNWLADALKKQMGIDGTYWYANATLWTEENPDAFAGLHNSYGELVIYDEASGIPSSIWAVTEGFFTEPHAEKFWFAFSNPRRNQGAFFDCFHSHKGFWRTRNLDSRTVEGTDVAQLNRMVEKYGADSDEARIEVYGQFPKTGDRQFISQELIDNAATREANHLYNANAPLIMGVDPARFGSDSTNICWRQGRIQGRGYTPPMENYRGRDNMFIADRVAFLANKYNPDAICIDSGAGAGIIDRLRQRGFKVHEIQFGGKAEDSDAYLNKRAEIWGRMRDWLEGAAIDDDKELREDLGAPEYTYMGTTDKLKLESKDDMKKRGVDSTDKADSLALTLSVNVAQRGVFTKRRESRIARDVDYNIFGG